MLEEAGDKRNAVTRHERIDREMTGMAEVSAAQHIRMEEIRAVFSSNV